MRTVELTQKPAKGKSDRIIPKIIKWKGTPMIRNHSFLATVDEICEYSKEQDVVRVGIIGDMGSGKTTMAKSIGHIVHLKMKKKFDIPFAVRIFYQADLLDFQNTLASLTPANYILIFDDVSFLDANTSKQEMSAIKQAITKIRHLPGGQDVKIILIYNYHYQLGFDKFLRQSEFKYMTTVGSSEIENTENMVKQKNMKKVFDFIRMRRKAIVKKYWSIKLTPKESFSYKWRQPFIPVLFYNNDSLRLIISPTREWIDRICSVCISAEGVRHSEIPIQEFITEGKTKHGERVFESAVKLKLFENGLDVYSKTTVNAKKWLDQALNKKLITLDQLMLAMGLKLTKTRLTKQFSNLIDDTPSRP